MIRRPPRSTLFSLHDALPISFEWIAPARGAENRTAEVGDAADFVRTEGNEVRLAEQRSEEHTSELQSQSNLVCRLLLEKKKKNKTMRRSRTKQQIHNNEYIDS